MHFICSVNGADSCIAALWRILEFLVLLQNIPESAKNLSVNSCSIFWNDEWGVLFFNVLGVYLQFCSTSGSLKTKSCQQGRKILWWVQISGEWDSSPFSLVPYETAHQPQHRQMCILLLILHLLVSMHSISLMIARAPCAVVYTGLMNQVGFDLWLKSMSMSWQVFICCCLRGLSVWHSADFATV